VVVAELPPADEMPQEFIATREIVGEEPTLYFKPGLEAQYSSVVDDQGRLVSETVVMDSDGDEAYDLTQVTEYEYAGEQISALRVSEDRGNDGVFDSRTTTSYAYNELGYLTSVTTLIDSNADGVTDQSYAESTKYDDRGNFLSNVSTEDTNGDGVADVIRTSANQYNENGSIASSAYTVDHDGNGVVDYRSTDTYAYDSEGNALTLTTEIDSNGDGTVDETFVKDLTVVYIADNFRGGEEGDGSVQILNMSPESGGQEIAVDPKVIKPVIVLEGTNPIEGFVPTDEVFLVTDPPVMVGDAKITTVEDEMGRVVSETVDYDNDGDGVIDLRTVAENTYEGDALASTRYSEDHGADGSYNYISTTFFTQNAAGQPLSTRVENDNDGDGTVDGRSSETYTYDEAGLVLTYDGFNDKNGDGQADSTFSYRYAYTAKGSFQSVVATFDNNGDGTVDFGTLEEYSYDESGMPVSLTTHTDENGDGVYDQTVVSDVPKPVEGGEVTTTVVTPGGPETQKTDTNTNLQTTGTGTSMMGDANGDGHFDSSDLLLLFQAGQYEDDVADNSSWNTGDWNNDGEFNSSDLVLAMQQGHYESHAGDEAKLQKPESTSDAGQDAAQSDAAQSAAAQSDVAQSDAEWAAAVDELWTAACLGKCGIVLDVE